PLTGFSYNAGAQGAGGDSLVILATSANDTGSFVASQVIFDLTTMTLNSTVENFVLDPGGGNDSVIAFDRPLTIPANTGSGVLMRHFTNLRADSGSRLIFQPSTNHANRSVIVADALAVSASGMMDLADNDLIVTGGSLATITNLLKTGLNLSSG